MLLRCSSHRAYGAYDKTEDDGSMKVNARRQAEQAEQAKLAVQLGQIGYALPGSLTVRVYRCGKANCCCHGDPPRLHGPYAFWTRKLNNKTVTRMLNNEEVLKYQPMFNNARKIRDVVSQLHDVSLELVEPAAASPRPKILTAAKAISPKTSQPRTRNVAKG